MSNGKLADPGQWRAYKARFLMPEGRIVDSGNSGISHSEGQGYGLFLAQAADDRTTFDQLLKWTDRTLRRPDIALYSWRYEPGKPQGGVTDPNNATDGDILIAWALLAAGKRWNHKPYLDQSAAIRNAIAQKLVVKRHGVTLLLPGLEGFAKDDRTVINLSYYVWPALDAFAETDKTLWKPVIDDGMAILRKARFGVHALPADWLDIQDKMNVEPARERDPLFGFEGIRIPLYCMMSGRAKACDTIARYWSARLRVAQPLPAWVNVVTDETAPYPLSAGATSIAARLLGRTTTVKVVQEDYYSATLALLNAVKF